jgi:hypothetical protein
MARTAPHHQVAQAVWPIAACPAPSTADAAAHVDVSHLVSTNASHNASKRGLAHRTVARRSVGGRT